MLRQDTAESSIAQGHFGLSDFQTGAGFLNNSDSSMFGRDRAALRRSELHVQTAFLCESDAASYLGMSTAQLTGLRKFDLALIEKGFRPHGPAPLWRGGICSYARDNLDEWIRSRKFAA